MRKLFYSILMIATVSLLTVEVKAQVFNGNLTLNTQAEVDAFNYTSVTGIIFINSLQSNITNLDGLSELTTVGKSLFIGHKSFTNLNGLSNLTSVGEMLSLEDLRNITNLDELSNLTHVGALSIEKNDQLTNIDALTNLTFIFGEVTITENDVLSSLYGLSNLVQVSGNLTIKENPLLTNLDGLSKLKFVVGTLAIENSSALTNVDGLSSLEGVGKLRIGLTHITNLDGLTKLKDADGITIFSNSYLTNIDGLSGLTTISGGLFIDITGITSIDGLSNVTKIDGSVNITRNHSLANLDGFSKLVDVGIDLKITDNGPALVDFCGLFKLFDEGTIGGIVEIKNNGANTVSITPAIVTVNADPGMCSAVIPATSITATTDGCLGPLTTTHSDLPATNTYPVGITYITWNATDGAGNSTSAVQTITVVDNQPPTITCPTNITVSCASDIPPVDIDAVTKSDNCSAVVTHVSDDTTNKTCANRFTLTRTYRATDPANNSTDCLQVITVFDNVPPQITGLAPSLTPLWPPNHTMRDITLDYDVSDNCDNLDTTISISSNESVNGTGDGDTNPDWEIVDKGHIRLRAERAANGDGRVYTITITVTDGCNSPVTATTNVTVAHNITGPVTGHPFRIGSTVDFAGTFWDKPGNKHTANWLIDDNTSVKGSVTEPTATKNGKAIGSYKFTTAGVYKLQMNITDQNKITSYVNTNGDVEELIVIYDPNGGYAYGGGWFNSPAGALNSDPAATGKVSYGFTTNYFKNSTYPKGETQFEFKIGKFEYNALNFDYLSISGVKAQFKGTGKIIGGQSGINFIMTVIDGDLDGTGIDKVRMKIYNKNTGQVYYDNQPGASDAANPTTAVGNNSSIVIQNTLNTITQKDIRNEEVIGLAKELEVTAIPNPSRNNFTLTIRSNNLNDKITMQVVDMYGRIIEVRSVAATQTIKLGDKYKAGTYFVKFIQGEDHKQLKLVKF
jgi:hypothetical protein